MSDLEVPDWCMTLLESLGSVVSGAYVSAMDDVFWYWARRRLLSYCKRMSLFGTCPWHSGCFMLLRGQGDTAAACSSLRV